MSILRALPILLAIVLVSARGDPAHADPAHADPVREWMRSWPRTDFTRTAVPLEEIRPGGPDRDGIPSIDRPKFAAIPEAGVPDVEPVVSVEISGDARAYPLRVLIWHLIVNDTVGGLPVAVTYCPLCSAALVYDRRVGGALLDFGSTGLLRYSSLIMYDRQSESWWQQYEGRGIVGKMTGAMLRPLPARLEAMGRFAERHPDGKVLVPSDEAARPYGRNPYTGYDSMPTPYSYDGPLPAGLPPLARVVAVGNRAWSLALVRARRSIAAADLVIEWTPGQSSPLDAKHIADGRDVGNVVVRRRQGDTLTDIPYSVEFAFVFKAFHPDEPIVVE